MPEQDTDQVATSFQDPATCSFLRKTENDVQKRSPVFGNTGLLFHKYRELSFALIHVFLITVHEFVNTSSSIDQLHLAGIEWV